MTNSTLFSSQRNGFPAKTMGSLVENECLVANALWQPVAEREGGRADPFCR